MNYRGINLKDINATDIKSLQKILKRNTKTIKSIKDEIARKSPDNKSEQIILDNFYIFNGITKALLNENGNLKIITDTDGYPLAGKLIMDICHNAEMPETETLVKAFTDYNSKHYVSNTEYEMLIWELRYCLLINIYSAITSKENDKKLSDMFILLSKSDTIDINEINNKCNPLELILNKDYSSVFSKMNSNTRQIYRDRITFTANKKNISEKQLAQEYIDKSKDRHIGEIIYTEYNKLSHKLSPKQYILIPFITAVILSIITTIIIKSFWLWLMLLFPFFEVAKTIIDYILNYNNEPTYLPRMELKDGIPDNAKTLAVISTLITSSSDIISLRKKLIDIYNTNPQKNIKILALCDLKEYKLPASPEDRILVRNGSRMISKMNKIYGDKFSIIIRNRTYSKTQNIFTGYERKRGAIEQLVKYIKEKKNDFLCFEGDKAFIKDCKYILTLDYDTRPLMDTVTELVSIALHPLNRPVTDDGKVINGYGIIAPRVVTSLHSSLYSPFTKLVGGIGSSCAYDTLSTETYQDNFNQSIFSGKGLIDVGCYYSICCNYFNEEQILSHDILEGELLRTAYAGDVEFNDSFPSSVYSYYRRFHRWVRGDIANISFLFNNIKHGNDKSKNRLDLISRFKISDNIRRALNPVIIFESLKVCVLLAPYKADILIYISLFAILLPYLISFFVCIVCNGLTNLTRKYYSGNISQSAEALVKGIFAFLLLPQTALYSVHAVFKALYRKYISHKNLLEWTTSSQSEKKSGNIRSFSAVYLLPFLFGLLFLFAKSSILKLIGLIYVFSPIIVAYLNIPYKYKKHSVSEKKREEIITQLSAMIQFYDDYAEKEDNFLPPDNVQFAPVYRVCHRTSPTNIGLMLLSFLIERDFKLCDTNTMFRKIDRTLSTVEQLKKYEGHLYNWYDTKTLRTCDNPYISSVDSGNFLCCLIALQEGLKEYSKESESVRSISERIDRLINGCTIGFFYDKCKNLISIGFNPETKKFSPNHYDLLMSESRMTSFYAISLRQIPKKHWRLLGRTSGKSGLYTGPMSYTGTMFEYFMPELFLSSEKGSLSYEGIRYCLYCQKKMGRKLKIPYGTSESGYFSFDPMLNYQYKAHGAAQCGLKQGLENDLVISPYSTYLTLEYDFNDAYSNLQKLKKYGMYANYGFYEAIDFTPNRASSNGSLIKSYMSHHIGMSIVSVSNALQDKRTKKRFMRNEHMSSAKELLSEKVISSDILSDNIYRKPETQRTEPQQEEDISYDNIIATQPDVKLLYNGEYTLLVTDSGICIAKYQDKEIYLKTTDILRRPEGCFFAVKDNNDILNFSYLPEYKSTENMTAEFSNSTVQFYNSNNEISAGMKISLHSSLPCEIRQFAVKNESSKPKEVILEGFIQPVLSSYEEYSAHPAFSKLFLYESYDLEHKIIIATRKSRDNDRQIFCAIGFIEDVDLFCNLSREEILKNIAGMTELFRNSDNIIQSYNSIPDPAVFLKTNIQLKSKEKKELNLFILASLSREEVLINSAKLRHEKYIYTLSSSVVFSSSLEGRLINTILPQLIFKRFDCKEITDNILNNTLGLNSLWSVGISGDYPVVVVNIDNINGKERITGYLKCHKILHQCSVNFDLVYLFCESNDSDDKLLFEQYLNENNSYGFFGSRGGIHLIDTSKTDKNVITLIKAVAVHIAPQSMVRILAPAKEYTPFTAVPVNHTKVTVTDRLTNGGFIDNTFIIDKSTSRPWCNILSNPAFGTLLSNNSLGFTYAVNSRENKLTPWYNDAISDNRGEMLILKYNNRYYDLVWGSTAQFSPSKAIYKGETEYFSSVVTVEVAQKAMTKKISVDIFWHYKPQNVDIALYTEPVLSVSPANNRMNVYLFENGQLTVKNPLNTQIKGYMTITSSEKEVRCITDNNEFLSGRWNESSCCPTNFPCGALISTERLRHGETKHTKFFISFGKTLQSSRNMHKYFIQSESRNTNSIEINTPDKNLNSIFNTWLNWQTLGGRIYARTGFSQNSGAWGFRDQLQDACACILLNSDISKRQIARACSAQFEEGDVLHWWHKLPGNIMKGVRTRYSDDLVWLPYTVCEYIEKTDDLKLLSLNIAYCKGIELDADKHEIYGEVTKSDKIQSIYNHSKRAVEKAYRTGIHELILMGGGDWNDSFNRVGIEGKGESVWLSEFMIIVLQKFSRLAFRIGDLQTKHECEDRALALKESIESHCWDGEWYIRAYFDNGDELGSKDSESCSIDSPSQSFATLAGLNNTERNEIALQSAYEYLVDSKRGLIKLFTPAFENNEMPVGYATSYPHGIRENGGQYTHGVIWLAIAFLESGNTEKGFELLNILNPANKYTDDKTAEIYKNEPYFMSADIYTNPQCYGRGGWSIYTGAAGWYYRAISEWFIGIKVNEKHISFTPHLPKEWPQYVVTIHYLNTDIHLTVLRGNKSAQFDNDKPFESIELDGKKHEVRIIII